MAETYAEIAMKLTRSQRALLLNSDDWTKSGQGFDELVALGLAERIPDADDEDVVLYSLTARGLSVAALLPTDRSKDE